MRKPLIAANWKMNNTVSEALKFVAALTADLKAVGVSDVVIAPPFTALYPLNEAFEETELLLAAQDMFWEESGAFTGEIAGRFLAEVGCTYVIIGHSERRQLFGETDASVNKKISAALCSGLIPIMCVGETLEEREGGQTMAIIERQLRKGLEGLDIAACEGFVVAYEPVWAIGTGRTATPEQAEEVHGEIRRMLSEVSGKDVARRLRIIYGGSVKPSNSRELLVKEDIDGALVGGASLDPKHFAAIVRSAH